MTLDVKFRIPDMGASYVGHRNVASIDNSHDHLKLWKLGFLSYIKSLVALI